MKRKLYLTALVMCMALAVNGCGSDKETTSTESEEILKSAAQEARKLPPGGQAYGADKYRLLQILHLPLA